MKLLLPLLILFSLTCFAQETNKNGTIKVEGVCVLDHDSVYSKVEKDPSFPGGDKSLHKFIFKNTKFPKRELEMGIEAMVVLKFIVDKNGTISNIEIFKSSENENYNQEAIRVLKLMPKWLPGECDNNKVSVIYYLPVHFNPKN